MIDSILFILLGNLAVSDQTHSLKNNVSGDSGTEWQKTQSLNKLSPNSICLFDIEKHQNQTISSTQDFSRLFIDCNLYVEMQNGDKIPFYPHIESQHIVDYSQKKVYYFNTLYEGKYSHFEFDLNCKTQKLYTSYNEKLNQHPLQVSSQSTKKFSLVSDVGLCIGFNRIFLVYGRRLEGLQCSDSDEVFYYDIEQQKWEKPTINIDKRLSNQKLIARHGVTCNYFQTSSNHYLYVFGGEFYLDTAEEGQKICNIVEFFQMDFKRNRFEHKMIDKKTYQLNYVPYYHSISLVANERIYLFGGRHYTKSFYENDIERKIFCFK